MIKYAVETFSLTKVFSDWWGRGKVCAVDDLNLKVRHNEVFGLLGPNGSGKTTTLKMLLGLLYPTKGKTLVLGGDATSPKISARVGFMPEESYLYRYLSARETLDFYGRLFDLPAKIRRMRIEALLDMVGLKAVANRAVGTFSKGMARRIGLAQALINDPEVLILDEPTTGLDPIGTRQIKDLVLELAKRGKTVLLCSHLLADVEDICDRIAILYGGKIQSEGNVRELLARTDKRQITTGSISQASVDKIRQIVLAEHADFEITSPMEKLESFFIKTITAARQKGLSAGGVASERISRISDFLAATSGKESTSERILEKLVSGKSQPQTAEPAPDTEQVRPVEIAAETADEQLLGELTEQPVSRTTSVTNQDKVERPSVENEKEQSGQLKDDILDRLTGRSEPEETDRDRPGGGPGGSSDA